MTCDRDEDVDYEVALENPMGTLRRRMPILSNDAWKKWIELKTIDYCAYDHEYKKRTDIFTSLKNWKPTGRTGTGQCENQCGHGSVQLKYAHFDNMYNVKGVSKGQRKNAVPEMLLTEILSAVREKQPRRKVVIDLCSGYQSMRLPAEKLGFKYIAVDIKDYKLERMAVIDDSLPSTCPVSTVLDYTHEKNWTHLYRGKRGIWRPCILLGAWAEIASVEFRCKTALVGASELIEFDVVKMDKPWGGTEAPRSSPSGVSD